MILIFDEPRKFAPFLESHSVVAIPSGIMPLDETLCFFSILAYSVLVNRHIAVITARFHRIVCP